MAESHIVAGLDASSNPITIILTSVDTTWVATVGADNAISTALLAGITSAQSETHGWNNDVRDALTYTAISRDSDTQVTITIPATTTYSITANETITITVPASATASAEAIVAEPNITVSNIDPPQSPSGSSGMFQVSTGRAISYGSTGANIEIGQ